MKCWVCVHICNHQRGWEGKRKRGGCVCQETLGMSKCNLVFVCLFVLNHSPEDDPCPFWKRYELSSCATIELWCAHKISYNLKNIFTQLIQGHKRINPFAINAPVAFPKTSYSTNKLRRIAIYFILIILNWFLYSLKRSFVGLCYMNLIMSQFFLHLKKCWFR